MGKGAEGRSRRSAMPRQGACGNLRSVLQRHGRIVRMGSGAVETWEAHFREKSRRRYARHTREKLIKAAVLALLVGATAAAILMMVTGVG